MDKLPTLAKFKTIILVLVFSSTASAQSLEEIVVTAQKRAENLQDVPVSISALTQEMVDELNLETAGDIAAAIPNLQASLVFGETQPIFTIRGMSMSDYNTNQASPVSVYLDEAPIISNFMQGLSIFDVSRIEVLRGPQGTLYGKNATGGAINFITNSPELIGTSGNVKIGYGAYDRKHVSGAVETALIEDSLGARVAFTYTDSDGYHDNKLSGASDLWSTDTHSVRLTLSYAAENIDAKLKITTGESDGITTGVINEARVELEEYRFDALGNTLVNVYGFLGTDPDSVAALGYVPRDSEWDAWEGAHNKVESYSTEFDAVNLRLHWDIGSYTISTVTSFLDGSGLNLANTDGAPYRLLEIDWGSKVEQFNQDIRIASNYTGPFNFISGIYFDEDELKIHNVYEFFLETQTLFAQFLGDENNPQSILDTLALPDNVTVPGKTGFTTDQRYTQERESLAVYFHSTYALTNTLTLNLGLRYTHDEGRGKDINTNLGDYYRNNIQSLITNQENVIGIPAFSTVYDPDQLEWEDEKVTGKLGIDYQVNDDIMLYASFSHGYRSSAFNGGAQFFASELGVADPETVDAYELGLKSQIFDGRVQLNAALFDYEYTGQQFVNVVGVQQFLVNGEKSSIRGAEVELVFVPTDRLSINAGLGYLDTEFEELSLYNTQLNDGSNIDLSGNELFNAPEFNFNAAFQYLLFEGNSSSLWVGANTTFIDSQWYSAYNELIGYEGIGSDSAWQSDANLSWRSADGAWVASLWVKNIEENDEPSYAINLQGGFGYDYVTVGLPRRWGADVEYRF